MIHTNVKHQAFTMIELIFVIVIMGIIGKFGTEFLAQAYESFIFSKINNDLQERSSSSIEFISKRLEHRIKQSLIARNPTTGTYNFLSNVGLTDDNATVLEWVATDIEGFNGTTAPLWSGILDLNASNSNRLISLGTNTGTANTQIVNLSNGTADINDTAIYFLTTLPTPTNPWGYAGAIVDQNETLHPIRSGANANELSPRGSNFVGKEAFEFYKLTWTAYAVELGDYNDTTHIGNLYLYYNYRPWNGETYAANGTKVLLAENINTFRYRAAGSLVKIQICAKSPLTGEEYALCKEKTIY
jgi:prepilin-type N-terminal cleavage/methylation domain-containing protein